MLLRSAGGGAALTVAFLVFAVGCSGNQSSVVTGTVRVDGELVDRGSITFIPADGMGQTAGGEIKKGKYVATKVSAGTMKVKVTADKVAGTKKLYDGPDSPVQNTYVNILENKYNSPETELRFEVKPGRNEKDWDLSSE
jgi:hypothetical protein